MGPFRLSAANGTRIEISSRKGQALIALLAVSGNGERTRSWLQTMLWGSRLPEQASASLRSELSSLRKASMHGGAELIHSDKACVWLDLSRIDIDLRNVDGVAVGRDTFLEGLDITGEEAFEDWLREERARTIERQSRAEREHTFQAERGQSATAPVSNTAQFAELPALAVLPFANLTGDAARDFLAEGISEDLIDRLSRLRWLPIIARSSSFAIRDADPDPRKVGATLGARYVLEGRLRALGDQITLTASLADSESGTVLWSSKLALGDSDAPEAIETLLSGLTSALSSRIDLEEQTRALRKPQSDLKVIDLIWRGRWHLNRMTREDSVLARECFAEALRQEPNSPEAIIQSAWARVWDLWARRGSDNDIRDMRQMAQRAIIADCDDARGHMLAGIAEIWLRQPLRAEALLNRAIALNPSLVMAYVQLGSSLRLRDEPERAIEALRTAIRLSPNDHDMFFFACELAASHLLCGQFEDALVHAEHAMSRRAAYWFAHVVKINALVRLDRQAEARMALAELMAAKEDFTQGFIDWQPYVDPRNNQFLKDGLNLAAT